MLVSSDNIGIGIVTCATRFDRYFKPLLKSLAVVAPGSEVIIAANGDYGRAAEPQYRRMLYDLLRDEPSVFLLTFPRFRGIAFLWNEVLWASSHDYVLLLNDDVAITTPTLMQQLVEALTATGARSFKINGSWSHVLLNRWEIHDLGYFDERLLGMGEEDGDVEWRYQTRFGRPFESRGIEGVIHCHDQSSPSGIATYGGTKYSEFNRRIMFTEKYVPDEKEPARGIAGGLRLGSACLPQRPYELLRRRRYAEMAGSVPAWRIFIVVGNRLSPEMYLSDPMFNRDRFRFLLVEDEQIPTPVGSLDVVAVREFPKSQALGRPRAESDALLNVYFNPEAYSGLDYVGFARCDMEFRTPTAYSVVQAIEDILASAGKEAVWISFAGHGVGGDHGQPVSTDGAPPDEATGDGRSDYQEIVADYNSWAGADHSLEEVYGKELGLCSSFLIPIEMFERMMDFVRGVIESGKLEQVATRRVEGEFLERYYAVFLAFEKVPHVSLNLVSHRGRKPEPG